MQVVCWGMDEVEGQIRTRTHARPTTRTGTHTHTHTHIHTQFHVHAHALACVGARGATPHAGRMRTDKLTLALTHTPSHTHTRARARERARARAPRPRPRPPTDAHAARKNLHQGNDSITCPVLICLETCTLGCAGPCTGSIESARPQPPGPYLQPLVGSS
jgi:hypothetical protein